MIVLPLTGSLIKGQSSESFPDGSGVLIVDELGPPNEYAMPSSIVEIVNDSGMQVVYVSDLTIEQFNSLASLHYRLIIFRVHSGPDSIGMRQKYSTWLYIDDQLNDEVGAIRLQKGEVAMTVTAKFVANKMSGTFPRSPIVLIEGCGTLADTGLAEAFMKRGAVAFVGWDGTVTLSHADIVTEKVLEKLLVKKETLGNSITESMKEAGADPFTGARLSYYPLSASSVSYGN